MAVLKVSIQLQTLAVLWTLFCVDRIADLSSFMDTFSMLKKLPDLGTSIDTEFQVSQNCQGPTVLSTLLTDNRKVSIKLLRSPVFVVLAYWVGKVSIKLLRSTVLFTQKCVHRTANVRSSMDTFKTARYGRISQVNRLAD